MRKQAYKIRLCIATIVLVLSIFAIQGFYYVKVLDLQFSALLQRALLTLTFSSVALLVLVVLVSVIFGRFYCSTICPFGILQEISALLLKKISKFQNKSYGKIENYPFKHAICAVLFGALFAGSSVLIRYVDPYTIFGSLFSLSVLGIVFAICVLALIFFKNRFFCTNICPVGAALGAFSKNACNKIKIDKEKCVSCHLCEKNCPAKCIDVTSGEIDNEICLRCLKCYSICPKGAINYGTKKIEFSPSKRKALIGVSLSALFVAGYLTGMRFSKDLAKKVKDVIFPAGAKNANKMANKCLNCNLCIKNCPSSILVKADDTFNTVHIDYKQGLGYCEFNCHKCAEVCPSGAIKRMPIEEKQNTRIAMAMVKENECKSCNHCVSVCPKNAITMEKGKSAKIDGSKCIGCGKCAKYCRFNAIEIFGIKEQTKI